MSLRAAMLGQLGLGPTWRLRAPLSASLDEAPEVAQAALAPDPVVAAPAVAAPASAAPLRPLRTLLSAAPVAAPSPPPPRLTTPAAAAELLNWDTLAETVAECRKCVLCERRKQAVLGVGDRQADWLFVGEGPGAEEDERGEPFVGQAGKLLDAMLAAIDLRRGHNVYIGNAVKCRPPNNRTPEPEEVAACFPYLDAQIQLIRPRLIVALGRPAAQALLNQDVRIGSARKQVFKYRDIPVLVTYHPAYLLRNLDDKRKAWEDLCAARRMMRDMS